MEALKQRAEHRAARQDFVERLSMIDSELSKRNRQAALIMTVITLFIAVLTLTVVLLFGFGVLPSQKGAFLETSSSEIPSTGNHGLPETVGF